MCVVQIYSILTSVLNGYKNDTSATDKRTSVLHCIKSWNITESVDLVIRGENVLLLGPQGHEV
jgi:hypothetical protein